MRKENPVLVYGNLTFSLADDQNMLLAYNRKAGNDEIVVVFNRSTKQKSVKVPVNSNGEYMTLLTDIPETFLSSGNRIEINLEPLSALVLKKK
jgi:hypothetical protein